MMLRIALLLLFALPAWSAPRTYGEVTVTRVVQVYDGDTFYCDIDAWPAIVGNRVPVRIFGIDTPEMKGGTKAKRTAARRARDYTIARLQGARIVKLTELRRDKYFRLNARVLVDDIDLGEALLAAGLATAYDGGHKP